MSKQAWITLATNDSYGLGALVLAHSLRRVGSAYPAVVLITPSVTEAMRDRLRAVFAEVVVVDVLDSRDAAHLALLQRPELGITFTKIHCWNLTQYEKAVFLDADTLVVQNCDELFEREELSAAPDVGWPDCFNSGVFVFRPSADTFSNIITFASERGSFDGGDQGLLNSYFSDWAHGDINKHLPFLYNVTSAAFYSYLPALKHFGQNLKIIHFIGAIKPWLQQYNWESRSVEAPEHLRDFLQLWWDLFVAEVHTQLDVNMDYVEEGSPVVEEENANYREQVLHNIHYEPTLDPESEFPWHHPDKKILDSKINVPEIDMSQHHDPWNIYRGNIPPSKEQSAPTEETVDDYQDMRKYAWDYMPPQHEQFQSESSHNQGQISYYSYQHTQNSSEFHHSFIPESQNISENHYHNNLNNTYQQNVRTQNSSEFHHLFIPESQNISENHYHNNLNNTYQQNFHTQNSSEFHHSFIPESQNISENHYHNNLNNTYQQNFHNQNDDDIQTYTSQSYNEQQISVHEHQKPHHSHEHHYGHFDHSQNTQSDRSIENNYESHINNYVSHKSENLHDQKEIKTHKKQEKISPFSQFPNQSKIGQVYTVMMDHAKMRCQNISEEKVNGQGSDSDSDIYEEITPRHPYDGFYLRHRMTIDSRGRKICIHEIPYIARSPSPESLEEFEDALEELPEEINDKTVNDEDSYTGVAGNLARVVPGAPLQREAVDELARRQGWEAGNIDYMGADSFDNIWAKISQTLSQPPAQPEQSSESQPEPVSESVPQQENDPIEAGKGPVETVTQKESVLATSEKEVVVEPSVEVPKPLDSQAEKELEPADSEAVSPESSEPVAAEIPTPASEASGKIEEPIPVPAENAAVKATAVEIADPVKSSSPTEVKEKTDEAEIPIAALEALKIDEPAVEAPVVEAPAVEAPSVEAPAVEVPAVEALAVEVAAVEVPAVEAPAVEAPVVEAPAVEAPAIEASVVEAPAVEAPAVKAPAVEAPAVEMPAVETPVVAEPEPEVEAVAAPVEAVPVPVEPAVVVESKPEAAAVKPEAGSDSPPLANTPSKEEIPTAPVAKSEERCKPAGKLQLRPPSVADPLPTPDSELEDAAALAHAIIAAELRTPTVTAPSPPAAPFSPAEPLASPAPDSRLSVQGPEVPTPPVGAISLSQIGVKPKPSTAAQIESSVTAKTEAGAPKPPEADAPRKKLVKKVVKKDKEGASSAEAPVPPPRKKEKKPKEK